MSQKYALKYSLRAREEINNNVRKNARFAHIMVKFGLVVREKRFSAHEAVLRIRDESIKKDTSEKPKCLVKVEIDGVEPTTLCLQSRCSSQLSYIPKIW